MENNISIIETQLIKEKIQKILRQTNYTEDLANAKLLEHNFNEIDVIKSYLGVSEKKPEKMKSLNQEIFKQIRYKLDSNMRDYQHRVEKGETKQI
jgi:hypothetical protein